MTMDGQDEAPREGVDVFLQAEADAQRLVAELARLKEEVGSYATARKALDETASGLSRLAGELATASQGVTDVIATLRSIGTAELLRAQDDMTTEVRAVHAEGMQLREALNGQLEDMGTEVGTLRETLQLEIVRVRETVDGHLTDLDNVLRPLQKQMLTELASTNSSISSLRTLLVGTTALLLLGLVIATGLMFSLTRT